MLDELYKENQLPKNEWISDRQITLKIDAGNLGKTQSK